MYTLVTTWLLCAAAFGQPLEVIAGDDLIAWQAIDEKQLSNKQLVANYQLFINRYPTSSLAEVAHGRIQSLQAELGEDIHLDASASTDQERIAESHELHADRLERGLTSSTIVNLAADGSMPTPTPSPWHFAAHAGAAWVGQSLSGVTGAEIRYRPVGLITRIGLGQTPYVQGGLRLTAPGWGPFAEMSLDTRGAVGLLAGGRYAVKHKLWLELSGGVEHVDERLGPAVRLELVHGL